MRSLIRPFLFIVARLGLFLSLLACVIGQWTVARQTLPHTLVEVHSSGWVITVSEEFADMRFLAVLSQDLALMPGVDPDTRVVQGRPDMTQDVSFPGVRGRSMGGWYTLYVRHLLIVSVFVVFHLCLSFTYRRGRNPDANTSANRPPA